MNVKWHEQHVLPRRASLEERMEWHRAHREACGCRPIPAKLQEQMGLAARAAPIPSAAETKFSNVVMAFSAEPSVTYGGKGFGSSALKLGGKIFAMLTSKGEFVVRLSRARAEELVGRGNGQYFDPGQGRLMKEWVVAPAGSSRWLELARDAHTAAQARRSRAASSASRPRAPARAAASRASESVKSRAAPSRAAPSRAAPSRARKTRSTR